MILSCMRITAKCPFKRCTSPIRPQWENGMFAGRSDINSKKVHWQVLSPLVNTLNLGRVTYPRVYWQCCKPKGSTANWEIRRNEQWYTLGIWIRRPLRVSPWLRHRIPPDRTCLPCMRKMSISISVSFSFSASICLFYMGEENFNFSSFIVSKCTFVHRIKRTCRARGWRTFQLQILHYQQVYVFPTYSHWDSQWAKIAGADLVKTTSHNMWSIFQDLFALTAIYVLICSLYAIRKSKRQIFESESPV